MCDDFMKEKENVRIEARKEIEKELKVLKEGRDTEIQRIYSRYVINLFLLVTEKQTLTI